ncbi:hypothetical protein K438DRAFT_1967951 [Mycena galopus ATCC 62051]|nr:hypothetical protein K438DRAFT_1967951 [Mycena galopus ATCC 62051]
MRLWTIVICLSGWFRTFGSPLPSTKSSSLDRNPPPHTADIAYFGDHPGCPMDDDNDLNQCAAVLSTAHNSWTMVVKRKHKSKNPSTSAESSGIRSTKKSRVDPPVASTSSDYNRYQSLSPPANDTMLNNYSSMPDPVPSPPANGSVPAKRIRRPTEKALQALEDPLPEGPGPLEEEPTKPAPIMLRIPRLFAPLPTRSDRTAPSLQEPSSKTLSKRTLSDIIWPYPNISSWLFGKWFWNDGTDKSKSSRKKLLDILLSGVFELDDLRGVNFDKIDNILGTVDTSEMQCEGNGWKTSTVTIKIPIGKKATKAARRDRAAAAQTAKHNDQINPDTDDVETQKFAIPRFHHRSLVHIICSIIEFDGAAKSFHWHPYEQYWTPAVPWALPDRVHDELYCSPAWIEADRKLQASPPVPGCTLPRVIAGLMFWSDATHVAQFGQAKLWPIYAYFAYLQSLPDTVQDFIRQESKGASAQLLAHCRRELFHESWRLLLDDEFVEAYKHGIVLDCKDGVCRRVYPRIFTYSADYPEKVLIATLRDMGKCPCPRCKIVKEDIPNLGTPADAAVRVEQVRCDDAARREKVSQARKYIYEDGYVVNSTKVNDLLKPESLVPTENAFSDWLDGLDFDIFDALIVDFMHETELGDFKSIIKHLILQHRDRGAAASDR